MVACMKELMIVEGCGFSEKENLKGIVLTLKHQRPLFGMNMQQVIQPRASANGFGRRKVERESGSKMDNKLQTGKTNSSRLTTAVGSGNRGGGYESPLHERLVYLTTCLIGHHVEVQVIDGSVYSGIFHATNAEKDFGIILKMARLTKSGSSRGQKMSSDSVSKPSKTLIIPARELLQIIAKGVSVTRDGLTNEINREKQQEIMTDSSISQSRHVEAERELGRWVPDKDNPDCPELENIFEGPWNRGWDQFEANETLFGVKSTFNEELYTTKLDRGPQMRDLEREATRLAREIEGEDTKDLHLAEERGIHLHRDFDIDEETRFSSVLRGLEDSGYYEADDMASDARNTETFGGVSDSVISKSFTDLTSEKSNDRLSSSTPPMDEVQSIQPSTARDIFRSGSNDHSRQLSSELLSSSTTSLDSQSRTQENQFNEQHAASSYSKNETLAEDAQTSKADESQSSLRLKKDNSDKGALSPNATAYAPSRSSAKGQEKTSPSGEVSESTVSLKAHGTTQSVTSRARPGSSTSSTSDCGNVAPPSRGSGLSPSSSVGSLSSEKSTLNPHAKEFKLNPNAKSFTPTQTPLRPASPVSDGSFYYPTNVATVSHMHGMPVGVGIGPSFASHHPVIFNPQAPPMQSSQAYFHSNGPQYGQQMILGQPRQVLYMPSYSPLSVLTSEIDNPN
ncbi:hypothetical protein RJ639_043796 [Escallonia herrerae]|uniref:LsmAD domain-containing protein n=1 Tax=Escallonia herrerae TaxID=1293975 RepID=A0AA89B0N6_9ASTE|nr:hypothetical protein RJ639_043796 [Escallonia herrerae]